MKQRSLPNKILLYVFPTIYFLVLISSVLFAVMKLHDRPTKLFIVGVFALYILYRFVNRTRILLREEFGLGADSPADETSRDASKE